MAGADRPAPEALAPERRLAELIIDRHGLSPPVDLVAVASDFADIETDEIPGQCDGLVIGLHGLRDRPLILLDSRSSGRRQRFTLAHELGHIVLPWHVGGSYLCNTGERAILFDEHYHALASEGEANGFAAELLVPSAWLRETVAAYGDEEVLPLMRALRVAEVSPHVACLRLREALPAGHVFAITDPRGTVLLSGQTPNTGVRPPPRNEPLRRELLDRFAMTVEEEPYGFSRVIWWTFRGGTLGDGDADEDPRTAREVLDALLVRHGSGDQRARLNGIIGSANSVAKRGGETSADALYGRFKSRFAKERHSLPASLIEDPELDVWLSKLAREMSE